MSQLLKESSHATTVQTPKNDGALLVETFRQPTAALRGKPFWSWNGDLQQDELLRQVDVLEEMGMGGGFMHSRTGLQQTYLGKEWFELINACSAKFEEKGMEGWIYDEDRWPSGSAGGLVTQEPEFRMRSIVLTHFNAGDSITWPAKEDFLEAHWVQLDGLDLAAYEPADYDCCDQCPDNKQLLMFVREIHPSSSFYNGGAYLDTLNRDATQAFIESTHEKYRENCGQHFGKAIKGIFTDEPHRGFILCDDVQQPGASRSSHAIPYTERLFDAFEEHFEHSLRGRLPELFFRFEGRRLSSLKWQYVELLQRLFLDSWANPCAQWCEQNGLALTGHVLHDDSLAAQVVPVGSLFRYYETMTYPGIDVLSKGCKSFWIAKQVVSTARQMGQPFVLSELYGATGWDLDFTGHKRIGDWQAFQGVNLRCTHLSWYSMAGEAKRDYPASIFHQSVWYPDYKYVEDYYARIHHLLAQGEPDCDVLVVHPGESLWAQFHLGWARWLGSDSADIDEIEAKFSTLYGWLTDAQIDFDYGDEEQMARLCEIETVDEEVFLRLGKMRYRTVVLGGLDTMRGTTLDLLKRFADAGGSVITVGAPAAYLNAELSAAPEQFTEVTTKTDWNHQAAVVAIRGASRQGLCLNAGESVSGVLSHVRLLENGDMIVALVNIREESVSEVSLHLPVVGRVQQWDCRTGDIAEFSVEADNAGLRWHVAFEPLQEHVFYVQVNAPSAEIGKTALAVDGESWESASSLSGPFDYELSEPNAYVLDRARHRVSGGEWQPADEILRIDDHLREQLGWPLRTGTMVQPWFNRQAVAQGPELDLEFEFFVETSPDSLELLMEQPDRWTLLINGAPHAIPANPDWRIDISLKRIELPKELLRDGVNTLILRTQLRGDTDLEAIYMRGDFGVFQRPGGLAIGALPERVEPGDLVQQGFPFYSGVISYFCELPKADNCQRIACVLPSYAGACAKVSLGDHEAMVAFPPYCAELPVVGESRLRIDLSLTRQNLLGPLHRLPKDDPMTSPQSFRTEGDLYSTGIQFSPAGLLEAPHVTHLKK